METLVVLHVTLVMSCVVVTLGPVRVMGAGVVVIPCVVEVSIPWPEKPNPRIKFIVL